MKKSVFVSFVFFWALSLANAQSKQTKALRFESESVQINCKANNITYSGNASCIVDALTIKNADEIEFDNKTKKLIEYTVGRTVAFMK